MSNIFFNWIGGDYNFDIDCLVNKSELKKKDCYDVSKKYAETFFNCLREFVLIVLGLCYMLMTISKRFILQFMMEYSYVTY